MLTATPIAASNASVVEPHAAPQAPAAKAASSILPSSAISTTPERSDSKPASAQNISGTDTRKVDASMALSKDSSMAGSGFGCIHLLGPKPAQQARQQRRNHIDHGARKQHDKALQHHHHVAAEARYLK